MTRRRISEIETSMFPFLSVLCVVIGILMLFMIVVISTRVIGAEESIVVQPPDPKPPGPDEGEDDDDGPGVPEDQYQALNDEIQRLTEDLAHQQKQYRELQELREQLETLIALKRDEIELGIVVDREPRGLGLPEKVKVVPDANHKVVKKPILVEVKAEGFVVHPEKTEYAAEELQRKDSPLQQFIRDVDQTRRKRYLLLLIHPNGVASYESLRKYLLENHNETVKQDIVPGLVWREITKSRIDLGYEPFSRDWLLIFEEQQSGN